VRDLERALSFLAVVGIVINLRKFFLQFNEAAAISCGR